MKNGADKFFETVGRVTSALLSRVNRFSRRVGFSASTINNFPSPIPLSPIAIVLVIAALLGAVVFVGTTVSGGEILHRVFPAGIFPRTGPVPDSPCGVAASYATLYPRVTVVTYGKFDYKKCAYEGYYYSTASPLPGLLLVLPTATPTVTPTETLTSTPTPTVTDTSTPAPTDTRGPKEPEPGGDCGPNGCGP